ncbi:dihydroneopterin aldolase [Caballeronia sp. LP006]|uniref:dihydroneopterin aldolase n=1 Tax=Caballeronia sp. LP006 TaxID=3038552 RepID=UPI002859B01E|nr:dihydroneopterin aldolase [Caballeronia sp. LP006]MDR5832316.1 dihydroneopterin aldolase [Caballeronia sp. LP006]
MDEVVFAPHLRGFAAFVSASCQVRLNNIEVMADIGVYEAEIGVPQPLLIDVAVDIVPPSKDELSQTFDYTYFRACAIELAAQRILLIETFAMRLAQKCLAHDAVFKAEVRIAKPRAVPGCLAGTCVTLSRSHA